MANAAPQQKLLPTLFTVVSEFVLLRMYVFVTQNDKSHRMVNRDVGIRFGLLLCCRLAAALVGVMVAAASDDRSPVQLHTAGSDIVVLPDFFLVFASLHLCILHRYLDAAVCSVTASHGMPEN